MPSDPRIAVAVRLIRRGGGPSNGRLNLRLRATAGASQIRATSTPTTCNLLNPWWIECIFNDP